MKRTAHRREVEATREEKDRYFKRAHNSPIPPEDRQAFEGLDYYPYDPDLVFEVELQREEDGKVLILDTSVEGQQQEYRRVGYFAFEADGEPQRLAAYRRVGDRAHDSLFVPFRDATSGKETYGAGRYLDLEAESGDTYLLDLNEAYNPYCAYNPNYVCPLPPRENWLDVPIEAGEKEYPLA